MKRTMLALCALALAAGATRAAAQDDAQHAVMRAECAWARAYSSKDIPNIRGFEADDYTAVYPDGSMGNRDQDVAAFEQGQVHFTSFKLVDMRVRSYGNVAVATGHSALTGDAMGQNIDGTYAFTDTWVMRDGKWWAVASQVAKVMGNAPPATGDACAM
jgi:ketosteroid isomerase-like protein